jgi:hypothetical protein
MRIAGAGRQRWPAAVLWMVLMPCISDIECLCDRFSALLTALKKC